MSKKGKIADPHAAREAERYDNPIPSREAILQLLADADQPLKHNEICRELALDDEDAVEALRKRLRSSCRATPHMTAASRVGSIPSSRSNTSDTSLARLWITGATK